VSGLQGLVHHDVQAGEQVGERFLERQRHRQRADPQRGEQRRDRDADAVEEDEQADGDDQAAHRPQDQAARPLQNGRAGGGSLQGPPAQPVDSERERQGDGGRQQDVEGPIPFGREGEDPAEDQQTAGEDGDQERPRQGLDHHIVPGPAGAGGGAPERPQQKTAQQQQQRHPEDEADRPLDPGGGDKAGQIHGQTSLADPAGGVNRGRVGRRGAAAAFPE
jgi:hypothetical protein